MQKYALDIFDLNTSQTM